MVMKRVQVVLLLSLQLFHHVQSSTKKDVPIPVFAPLYGMDVDRYAYMTSMKYAFQLINERDDILTDYNLVPNYLDTVGRVAVALNQIMDVVKSCENDTKVPPAIIGPAFSKPTVAVAQLLSYTHKLHFSYAATTSKLDDSTKFHYTITTVPGTSAFNRGYVALMKNFGWSRVGIFFDHNEQDGIFIKNTENLIKQIKLNNMTVVDVESAHVGSSYIIGTSDNEIKQRLEKLKKADVKIFIGQFKWFGAYRIFCQVYKLGMYGKGYVWVVHPRVETVEKWLKVAKDYPELKTDCTEEQYYEVSQRILVMTQQTIRPDPIKTISGLTSVEYNKYISEHRPKLTRLRDLAYANTTWHANGFDAIWTMALTLNNSIPKLKENNLTLDKLRVNDDKQNTIIKENVFNVSYEGITGRIRFDPRNNGRIIGSLSLKQYRGRKMITLGNFEVIPQKLHFDPETSKDMWIGGKVPLDKSYHRTILLTIPLALYCTVTTIAGLGIVLAIGVLIFNVYNRNKRYIRKSAPMFNNAIVTGIILCLSTVPFFGVPVTLGETEKFLWSCKLRSWALCLGFSLSFGSMFVKTWRVYKIFTNRKLKYSIDRLSNTSLIAMIISIVAVDVFILMLWAFLDPIGVKLHTFGEQTDPDDANTVLVPILYTCFSEHQSKWVTTIYVIKGVLLLYGLFLAYETRNVQFDHLNDSRMIGVCVYNVAVMSVLGALLSIILNETYYKESFGISGVCIIFPSLGTLLLIFLPKGKQLILGIEPSPSGYSRVVRFVKNNGETESSTTTGVVYDGPGTRTVPNNLQLRKDSVDSEGITSMTSSLPMSSSRIMPIYEEANGVVQDEQGPESPTTNSQSLSSSGVFGAT